MGARGPKPKDKCVRGHDLTDPGNVQIVQRKRGGKIYKERQCKPCRHQNDKKWRDKQK